MQTTAIVLVTNSLPENDVIRLTFLISSRYILYTNLRKDIGKSTQNKNYLVIYLLFEFFLYLYN